MIDVIASVRVKAGKVPEFLKVFKSNMPKVKKERGCIEYFPAIDLQADLPGQILDKDVITIIEKWESLEALRDHLNSPGMQDQHNREKGMVEEVTAKILQEA
jgi:quinol monooxygenase YgiN